MKSLAMTTLEPLTKVVSKDIQNVGFVENGSMVMTSYTPTAETSMRSVISAIGGTMEGSNNITSIMTP